MLAKWVCRIAKSYWFNVLNECQILRRNDVIDSEQLLQYKEKHK